MKKITKILVPVDFSKPSANAFRYALQLADKIGASLQVLNVVNPRDDGLNYPVLVAKGLQQRLKSTRVKLKKFINTALTATGQVLRKGPMISSDIEVGTTVQTICDVAQKEGVTIIIIGSRGENKSRLENFLGSVAAGVVREAKSPVLVIPEAIAFTDIKMMTYAAGIKNADTFEIWKALDLIQPFKPSIDIVHVKLKKEGNLKAWEKLEQMKSLFKKQSAELDIKFHHIPGEEIQEELNDFIKKHPTNILVMYQPQHDFWDRLFYKSTTKQMALHTKVPLLVLKSQ